MSIDNPATLTVVTGSAGTDLGPVAAYLGRDLGDGLAVRTVVSERTDVATPHSSPNPHPYGPGGLALPPVVHLDVLPSAWQDPHTNLGVVYTGAIDSTLRNDVYSMAQLGLDPSHRLTVQHQGVPRGVVGTFVPVPIEVGDVGQQARDAVLRGAAGGSRHVLVEAGDGQTFLDALHTLGLPPWSPHIDELALWLVLDAARLVSGASGLIDISGMAAAAVAAQGGGTNGRRERMPVLHLALLNAQILVPALAGVDSAAFNITPAEGGTVGEDVADAVGAAIFAIEQRAGASVGLLGTGPGAFIDLIL